MTRSNTRSGTSTVLIVLLIVFTFPIWIGLAGGLIGIVGGLFGAVIGIIGGIFGAIFGLFGGIFNALFGWHGPFGFNVLLAVLLAFAIIRLTRAARRNR